MGAKILKSFQAKVTVALIGSMLLLVFLSNVLVHRLALEAQFEQLRDKLKMTAQVVALSLDAQDILAIPLDRSGENTPQFKHVVEGLRTICKTVPAIRYLYVLVQTDKPGQLRFVADVEFDHQSGEVKLADSGDRYDASRLHEMLKAFEGPAADRRLEKDAWGMTLSGYAPIRDQSGRTVAILGVDMLASEVYATQQAVHWRVGFLLILGILFAVLMGLFLSRRISSRIRVLSDGISHIAQGDLRHKVQALGSDEVGDLARSFNGMADELEAARQKNVDYFYGIIQSLVRTVEAKDPYTFGHSERVAEYAARIAARMGLPREAVEMIRHAAVLHDIGKLAIKDSLLNKKEMLTPEEWAIIRHHPVTGEEILRPVAVDPAMLAMVRSHHERYDGAGYPDGLAGDKIDMFAQILTVADAFDAMTSSRSYRGALSCTTAVEEIRKGRGAQFNPKVVDAFLGILREEDMRKDVRGVSPK